MLTEKGDRRMAQEPCVHAREKEKGRRTRGQAAIATNGEQERENSLPQLSQTIAI